MTFVLVVSLALSALPLDGGAEETAVHLAIQPMDSPKPALKHQLLPEIRELNPGNPAQWYIRCFQEQRNFFFGKQATSERARYRSMPLAELPAEQLRHYGGSALTQADWAARLETPDWQVLQRVQTEGVDLTLPELVPLRVLAAALQVRFRGQVAGRHFDEAIQSAKTMFALARHLGEYPTVSANQVGLSVANLALDTLEEMIQQRGCPNLYWAFTDLPSPLVDIRKGVQGERAIVATELKLLRDDAPMSNMQVEEFVGRLSGTLGFAREQLGLAPQSLRVAIQARANDAKQVGAARRGLLEAGFSALLVFRLAPSQLILLDEKRRYEFRQDEDMKLLGLAPWQIDVLDRGPNPESRRTGGLFADLLPIVIQLRRAQARLEQRIALLRHVEALRLYAARHDGKLPQHLADIPAPLCNDPFTGKPFDYKLEGATAWLRGNPPRADEKIAGFHNRYEVKTRR